MNNTRTLAIVAVLAAATLVVGLTVAATMTPSAFAGGGKKVKQDMRGGGQDGYKKDGKILTIKEQDIIKHEIMEMMGVVTGTVTQLPY